MSGTTEFEVEATGLLPEPPEVEQETPPSDRPKTAREKIMEEIYARRSATIQAESEGYHMLDGEKVDGGGVEKLPQNALAPEEEPTGAELDVPFAEPEPKAAARPAKEPEPAPEPVAVTAPPTQPTSPDLFPVTL